MRRYAGIKKKAGYEEAAYHHGSKPAGEEPPMFHCRTVEKRDDGGAR
jgi:hypothetical protein